MNKKTRIAVLGATGMVGQRFISLLEGHPFFDLCLVAASSRSAGKRYFEAVSGRWKLMVPMPEYVRDMVVADVYDVEAIASKVDMVLCALDMEKDALKRLEEDYARAEVVVVSNNSANRDVVDVPMIIPEINAGHLDIVEAQKKRLGTERGFIVCKPNCSIQSYVPAVQPLLDFGVESLVVSTYQAISGSGKTLMQSHEILDNIIPYIGGEEEKSEKEPLKIWGHIGAEGIVMAEEPTISAQCVRVPVQDGHLATVFIKFKNKPTKEQIIKRWKDFISEIDGLSLPMAPKKMLEYSYDENRPQTRLDRNAQRGMGITIGRLRADAVFDYKFVCLSHNTLRGAAGGALLLAELIHVRYMKS